MVNFFPAEFTDYRANAGKSGLTESIKSEKMKTQ